ncbi:MAG: winged helix-turn-helix transcriptional regulator [Povalibacter sp.]
MSSHRQSQYFCPINVTLSVINGKWKPLILYLLKNGPRRFNALQAGLPRVSHKVLTQQLREMQAGGLIECTRAKTTSTYRLTDVGVTLKPSLAALAAWGLKHHRAVDAKLIWPPARVGNAGER